MLLVVEPHSNRTSAATTAHAIWKVLGKAPTSNAVNGKQNRRNHLFVRQTIRMSWEANRRIGNREVLVINDTRRSHRCRCSKRISVRV